MIIPIVGCDEQVGSWVFQQGGSCWWPNRGAAIGALDVETGQIVGGVVFEGHIKRNIFCHMCLDLNGLYLPKKVLDVVFRYAFVQIDCDVISGLVLSNNAGILRLMRQLGFQYKATINRFGDDELQIHCLHKDHLKPCISRRIGL